MTLDPSYCPNSKDSGFAKETFTVGDSRLLSNSVITTIMISEVSGFILLFLQVKVLVLLSTSSKLTSYYTLFFCFGTFFYTDIFSCLPHFSLNSAFFFD